MKARSMPSCCDVVRGIASYLAISVVMDPIDDHDEHNRSSFFEPFLPELRASIFDRRKDKQDSFHCRSYLFLLIKGAVELNAS
jgi:hypothetical protein